MIKKSSSEILADEIEKHFWEKVKLGKFSTESENSFGNRGKSETWGDVSLPQGGMDAPGH